MKFNVLKANQVQALLPGTYGDGMGLSLKVAKSGSRSWVYRYRFGGLTREAGLGSAAIVPLSVARAKRDEMLRLLQEGKDPLHIKQTLSLIPTFDQAAKAFIEAKRSGWKNAKHAQQWTNTLATYASPTIGQMPIDKIESAHVVAALASIWKTKNETAGRVRGRIHQVLGAARYRAGLKGINPAEWKDHLQHDARLSHAKKVKHFASLPHEQVGELLRKLMGSERVSHLALALTILTAARTGSIIGARWSEIDEEAGIWHIPGERMKMKLAFDVPLSKDALAVLGSVRWRHPIWVFPSPNKPSQAISSAAMSSALCLLFPSEQATVHGFRSSFRSWCGDAGVDFEIAEESLAHAKANSVVKAYHRSDMILRRRVVIDRWANYLATKPAPDVNIRKAV